MSRSEYSDDCDDWWAHIRWRGTVKSAIRGARGQRFLRDLAAALDAMPVKELVEKELITPDGGVCAMGCVALARGVPKEKLAEFDPTDHVAVAKLLDIADPLAREVAFENDEQWSDTNPAKRWQRTRQWVAENLKQEPVK